MILKIFANLNDSIILWFYTTYDCKTRRSMVGGNSAFHKRLIKPYCIAGLNLRGDSDRKDCILEAHSHRCPCLHSRSITFNLCWRTWILSRKIACLTTPTALCFAEKQTPKEYSSTSVAASAAPCLTGCYVKPVETEYVSSSSEQVKHLLPWQHAWSCNHTWDTGNMLASWMFTEPQTFTRVIASSFHLQDP